MHPQRPRMKSSIHQETRHRVRRNWLTVNRGDQNTLVVVDPHLLLPAPGKEMRQACGGFRPLRVFAGKEAKQVWIVASQPCDKLSITQNNLGINRASENAWRRLSIVIHHRQIWPAKNGTIRI